MSVGGARHQGVRGELESLVASSGGFRAPTDDPTQPAGLGWSLLRSVQVAMARLEQLGIELESPWGGNGEEEKEGEADGADRDGGEVFYLGGLQGFMRQHPEVGIGEDLFVVYLNTLDRAVAKKPNHNNSYQLIIDFYFILDQKNVSGNHFLLGISPYKVAFQEWIHKFAVAWGENLDKLGSIDKKTIDGYVGDIEYRMADYKPLYDSGLPWRTFNEWFCRKLKDNVRPVYDSDPSHKDIIVFPADSTVTAARSNIDPGSGPFLITEQNTVISKGHIYNLDDLLKGSHYQDRFKNGVLFHVFLNVNDYHRYHSPVSGRLVEVMKRHELAILSTTVQSDILPSPPQAYGQLALTTPYCVVHSLHALDDLGYQFFQTRSWIMIDTGEFGLVCAMPMGMAQVSSVGLDWKEEVDTVSDPETQVEEGYYRRDDVDIQITRGQEIGCFKFGGSDYVMLFEKPIYVVEAARVGHHLMGNLLGRIQK